MNPPCSQGGICLEPWRPCAAWGRDGPGQNRAGHRGGLPKTHMAMDQERYIYIYYIIYTHVCVYIYIEIVIIYIYMYRFSCNHIIIYLITSIILCMIIEIIIYVCMMS